MYIVNEAGFLIDRSCDMYKRLCDDRAVRSQFTFDLVNKSLFVSLSYINQSQKEIKHFGRGGRSDGVLEHLPG